MTALLTLMFCGVTASSNENIWLRIDSTCHLAQVWLDLDAEGSGVPIRGYSFAVCYSASVEICAAEAGSYFDTQDADVLITIDRAHDGCVAQVCLLSLATLEYIPARNDLHVLRMALSVGGPATLRPCDCQQTMIAFSDGAVSHRPPKTNLLAASLNCNGRLGDVNRDASVTIADAIQLLTFLFQDPDIEPFAAEEADYNLDGAIDISDVVSILGALF